MTLERKKNWKLSFLRGLILTLFGIYSLFESGNTVKSIMSVFGIFILVFGLLLLLILISNRSLGMNFPSVEAFLDILIGVMVIAYPQSMAELIVIIMGLWILLLGLFILQAGYRMRELSSLWFIPFFSGLITAILGVLLLSNPFGVAKASVAIIGLFALIAGLGLMSNALSKTEIVLE